MWYIGDKILASAFLWLCWEIFSQQKDGVRYVVGILVRRLVTFKVEHDRLLYVVWNFLFHLMRNLLFYIDM
jgi:hypothetical protein